MSYERKRRKAMAKRKKVKKQRRSKRRIEYVFNLIPLIIVVIVTILILNYTYQEAKTGPPAPDFTIQDIATSRYFTLHATGKESIVVVTFFGTDCPNCHTVMMTLKQIREEFSPNIILVSIAPPKSGDTYNSLTEYIDVNVIKWLVGLDPYGDIASDYTVTTLPTTVIIDRRGNIEFRQEGLVSFETLDNKISQLLREQPRVPGQPIMILNYINQFETLELSKFILFW